MALYPKLILDALEKVRYPGNGKNLVEADMVDDNIRIDGNKVSFSLIFEKPTDPFIRSVVKSAETAILTYVGPEVEIAGNISVVSRQQARPEVGKFLPQVKNVIAISSGKGGVGKSTVTANLALTLRNMGYRVGLLDADIYGPSQPKMFGCEGYLPDAVQEDGQDYIVPAQSMDIELMSIGFFINPNDALMWRGAMATNALKQLLHQTKWGGLDFLLIDMPPGTGDIHLTMISEIKMDGAVIVSTPQQVAVADVVRGVEMFRHEQVAVPVLGVVENMAWFTPKELPNNRYYIFGEGGAKRYAAEAGVPFLGEIPLIQTIMEGGECGTPTVETDAEVERYYRSVAERMISELFK